MALQPEPRGAPGHPAARSQERRGVSHRRPWGLSQADTWALATCPQRHRRTRFHWPHGRARDGLPWPQE